MINQIRAEIIKIRSTRTTLGLVIGMLVLVIAITLLTGLLESASDLANSKENQLQLLNTGSIAGVFAALAGILIVTSETRFGTIRPTFLVTPSWTPDPRGEGHRDLHRGRRHGRASACCSPT